MESHSYSNTTSSSYKEEKENLIDKNNIILMNKQLGKGGFGNIYLGRNLKENVPTAIKIEKNGNRSYIKEEYKSLKALQGLEGIPRVFKFLKSEKQNYLIMELLGKSIETLFNKRKKHFTNKVNCYKIIIDNVGVSPSGLRHLALTQTFGSSNLSTPANL